MALPSPRASAFISQQEAAEDHDSNSSFENPDPSMTLTPLERTIDRVGMGSYQWSLLSLCGLGWMADNMWLQAVAIILPRVQDQYSIPDKSIGWLSTSIFFGMMLGALGWGTCSDLLGRTMAFNLTLLFTSIFGVIASTFVSTFPSLCISLFFLGTAIGGSMPTDGTLFLENVPRRKQYLLTLLSVFFSFGAVLSALLGIVIIPSHSCPESTLPITSMVGSRRDAAIDGGGVPCDVATQNLGWRYLLMTLSTITISMFIFRILFFKLHESPRFLVSTGRPAEAVLALRRINSYNGVSMDLDISDVHNEPIDDPEEAPTKPEGHPGSNSPRLSDSSATSSDYQATTSHSEAPLANGDYQFQTPTAEHDPFFSEPNSDSPSRRPASRKSPSRRNSSVRFNGPNSILLNSVLGPLRSWVDRIQSLLTDEWRRTTLLMWAAWCLMSLAYTMFNVFLPKLLESRLGSSSSDNHVSRKRAMWDVVIFTLGGCPGAILGAWMIETPLGRRKSLALSTFTTAFFCAVFAKVTSQAAITASSMAISLAVTTMWAVLYGMTPETFEPAVRGTAVGTASALSRLGGMIAPIVGGSLLNIDNTLPVYTAVVIFVIAGICVLLLPPGGDETEDDRRERRKNMDSGYHAFH